MELKDFNVKILKKANKIFAENNMQTLEERILRGGSDAAYVTLCGIPCIDSFGTQGGGSHSINEYAKRSWFDWLFKYDIKRCKALVGKDIIKGRFFSLFGLWKFADKNVVKYIKEKQ